VSDRYDPRERWRWEEEREREDQGMEAEGRFARHGGDPRWGTGGLGADRRARRPIRGSAPPSRESSASGRFLAAPPYREAPPDRESSARGPFVGLGPRGYRRSDERIYEDVCERLTRHGDIDASDTEVVVSEGEVTLSGTVATRAQKRLAEDIADAVIGVVEVHNRLRLRRPPADPPETPARGAPIGEGPGAPQHPAPPPEGRRAKNAYDRRG
jgi:hypothetical protein